jgi:hypothetical protein
MATSNDRNRIVLIWKTGRDMYRAVAVYPVTSYTTSNIPEYVIEKQGVDSIGCACWIPCTSHLDLPEPIQALFSVSPNH